MKLKTFDKTNGAIARSSAPMITVAKTGLFALNGALCKALNLPIGGGILIHQDEASPTDWYIEVSKSQDAFVLRDYKKGNLCFAGSAVAKEMRHALKQAGTFRHQVATVPVDDYHPNLYAIFTSIKK